MHGFEFSSWYLAPRPLGGASDGVWLTGFFYSAWFDREVRIIMGQVQAAVTAVVWIAVPEAAMPEIGRRLRISRFWKSLAAGDGGGHKAEDTKLRRAVALSICPENCRRTKARSRDSSVKAQAASALNHQRNGRWNMTRSIHGTTQHLGYLYHASRRYDLAIAQQRRVIELDPTYFIPHLYLSHTYAQIGQLDLAIAAAQKASELSGRVSPALDSLAGLTPWPVEQPKRGKSWMNGGAASRDLCSSDVPGSGLSCLGDMEKGMEWMAKGHRRARSDQRSRSQVRAVL